MLLKSNSRTESTATNTTSTTDNTSSTRSRPRYTSPRFHKIDQEDDAERMYQEQRQRSKRQRSFLSGSATTTSTTTSTSLSTSSSWKQEFQLQWLLMKQDPMVKDTLESWWLFTRLLHMDPEQTKQFVLGTSVLTHVLSKYSSTGMLVNNGMRQIIGLVVLPFCIPPAIVVGVPLLVFLFPMLLLGTTLHALNAKANRIMEENKRKPKQSSSSSGRSFFLPRQKIQMVGTAAMVVPNKRARAYTARTRRRA